MKLKNKHLEKVRTEFYKKRNPEAPVDYKNNKVIEDDKALKVLSKN